MRGVGRWPTRRAAVLDAALAAAVLLVDLAVVVLAVPGPSDLTAAARLATGVLVAAGVLLRRRLPLVLLTLAVLDTVAREDVSVAMPLAAYAVVRHGSRARPRWTALALAAVPAARPWLFGSVDRVPDGVLQVALLVVLPAVLGAWVRTRAELLVALRERAERAEHEQQSLAREAVLEERVRIAREMHDVVGHRVSLMVLQAGAIDMAAGDPERVRLIAGQLQDAGRRSLHELRQLIGLVQDDDAPLAPQPTLADLDDLVEDARRAGLDVTLERRGRDREVEPTAGRAAYRVVQEALTNAGKHAPGGPVRVIVELAPDSLILDVRNGRATRPATALPSGGLGLVGLRERVRTVGGTFRAEPRLDGGFGVEAVLPG